jgi:hypothetical protein
MDETEEQEIQSRSISNSRMKIAMEAVIIVHISPTIKIDDRWKEKPSEQSKEMRESFA